MNERERAKETKARQKEWAVVTFLIVCLRLFVLKTNIVYSLSWARFWSWDTHTQKAFFWTKYLLFGLALVGECDELCNTTQSSPGAMFWIGVTNESETSLFSFQFGFLTKTMRTLTKFRSNASRNITNDSGPWSAFLSCLFVCWMRVCLLPLLSIYFTLVYEFSCAGAGLFRNRRGGTKSVSVCDFVELTGRECSYSCVTPNRYLCLLYPQGTFSFKLISVVHALTCWFAGF